MDCSTNNKLLSFFKFSKGDVFYFNCKDHGEEPHYYIILNPNPEKDTYLIVSICTSKDKYIKSTGAKHVFISKDDYSEFTKDTYVNCDIVSEFPQIQIKNLLAAKEIKLKNKFPDKLLNKIINKIKSNGIIEGKIRKQL